MQQTDNQTTIPTTSIDRFSWRRMLSIGTIYMPAIRRYLTISIILSIANYLIMALSVEASRSYIAIAGVLGIVLSWAIYLCPIVFSGRDETLMAQLPVASTERLWFYILYSVVIAPVIINGVWYLACFIGSYFFEFGNLWLYIRRLASDVYDMPMNNNILILTMINGTLQSIGTVMVVLYVSLTSRSHHTIKAILASVGCVLALGFISGIIGFTLGMSQAMHEIAAGISPDPSDITANIKSTIQILLIIADVLFIGISVWVYLRLRRRFKSPNIA